MFLFSLYKNIYICSIGAFFVAMVFFVSAQEVDTSVETRRAQLQSELKNLEQQIAGFDVLIGKKQQEAVSIKRDIDIIDAEIERAKLEIRRRNLAIKEFSTSIDKKSLSIKEMSGTIDRERTSLAEALRKLHEYDNVSLMELLLGYEDLSDFFL